MPRLATALLFVLAFGAASAAQELPPIAPVAPLPPPFPEWLASVREEAAARGIRPEILEQALDGVEPVAQILDRDRSQAEFTLDLAGYLKRRLTPATIRTAQQMYSRHRALLGRVGEKYGVNPRILVAVWGLESNFGRFAGVRPTIPTLVTLAYDQRRATFFRSELFSALDILNRGDVDISEAEGIVGRCPRPAAVHALELPGVRAGLRRRRPPRHLDLGARRVRLDRLLHAARTGGRRERRGVARSRCRLRLTRRRSRSRGARPVVGPSVS